MCKHLKENPIIIPNLYKTHTHIHPTMETTSLDIVAFTNYII